MESSKKMKKNKEKMQKSEENNEIIEIKPINELAGSEIAYIKNKRQFMMFKKLVKEGKFTSAFIASQLIGVSYNTVRSWMELPYIQKLMNEEVSEYVSKIKASTDWKAQAYLLDSLKEQQQQQQQTTTMVGLAITIQK